MVYKSGERPKTEPKGPERGRLSFTKIKLMSKANIRDSVLDALAGLCPEGTVSDKILSLIAEVRSFRSLSYIAVSRDVVPVIGQGKPAASIQNQTTDAT